MSRSRRRRQLLLLLLLLLLLRQRRVWGWLAGWPSGARIRSRSLIRPSGLARQVGQPILVELQSALLPFLVRIGDRARCAVNRFFDARVRASLRPLKDEPIGRR